MGQHAFCHIEGAADVADKDIVPHLQGNFVHPAVLQAHVGRVVDQNVNAPVGADGVLHQLLNAFGNGNIHGVEAGLAALCGNGVHNALAPFCPAAAYNHLSALRSIEPGDAHPDAAGGTGNNGYLVL